MKSRKSKTMSRLKIHYAPIVLWVVTLAMLFSYEFAQAATLLVSPNTGVYSVNNVFTARVVINTMGQAINAAEGTLQFDPNQIQVVSIDRTGSIFNLWVTEPAFSNTAGTITFSGGAPSGYTGAGGVIFNVTLRARAMSESQLRFTTGAILANDGRGTNILTSMNGGTFTIQAVSTNPAPEQIEYVAPANTPSAPKIVSTSHPDQDAWYKEKEAKFTWILPPGTTAVRTLLDQAPSTIPTRVYEPPIGSLTVPDLPDGISYLHVQFKNAEGWGRVTHYRLQVDTDAPEFLDLSLANDTEVSDTRQKIKVEVSDATSPVNLFLVTINNQEPFEFKDTNQTRIIELPSLPPGFHTVIVEAKDASGNSVMRSLTFNIEAFAAPVFTEAPTEISDQVIPVFRGETVPGAKVVVSLQLLGSEAVRSEVLSDEQGVFTFIPAQRLATGVYEISAKAIKADGAQSADSVPLRIAVQPPGLVRIGSWLVSLMSIIVPLVAITGLLGLLVWWLYLSAGRLRRRVGKESAEALAMIEVEFSKIEDFIKSGKEAVVNSRRLKKLSTTESEFFNGLLSKLSQAKANIKKEAVDVKAVVNDKKDAL